MTAPLVQLTRSTPPSGPTVQAAPLVRKPAWLKVRAPGGATYLQVKTMMRELDLNTVCEEARCPNIGECWEHRAATFMILGDVCTRNCAYCAVAHGTPAAYDPEEPVRLAEAVARMGLAHVVITSVDRDDLPNGGAEAFAACVTEIRSRLPEASVEVLIPDFKGSEQALRIVLNAKPAILNHNLETCERFYPLARPGGRYARALKLLADARRLTPEALTKSGIILGLGEEWDEVITCMRDLRQSDVNILTLGQYLRPTDGHLPIARYYTPEEFSELAGIGMELGFTHVQASPLTRSSYHAWEQADSAARRLGGWHRELGGMAARQPDRSPPQGLVMSLAAGRAAEPPSRRAAE
jgi:lipoic acid synthetase